MGSKRAHGRRPQQARRDAARAALLRAAGEVFADRGFVATTLDAVASAAGVTKGAIYYAFDGKEELFLALQEERFDALAADVGRARDAMVAGQSVGPTVAAGLPFDRDWNRLFLEFVAHAIRRPAFRARLLVRLRGRRNAHADAVQAVAEGTGKTLVLSPERLARLMSGLANGLAIDALIDPDLDAAALLGEGFELLWRAATTTAFGESGS